MRRTTLGPLSGADLNSSFESVGAGGGGGARASLSSSFALPRAKAPAAPAGASAKKAAAAGGGRTSMAPGGGGVVDASRSFAPGAAASAAAGSSAPAAPPPPPAAPALAAAKRKDVDPRPLTSKKWQEDATDALVGFLEACGYNAHLTRAAVAGGLNTKEFSQVFNFLLRGFDASFVINGKVETEVTDVIKALHYPFPPSKTALSAIGAAHSWPAFLGLLTWLRELLAYDRATAVADAAADAASAATPGAGAHFWAYLCSAYTHYLAGADDAVAGLEAAVDASFDAARAAEEAEEERLNATMLSLLGQLQALQAQKAVLPSLRARRADTAEDVAALTRQLSELEVYRDELSRKADSKARAAEDADAEVGRLRAELDRVVGAVAAQELSQDDVRRLRAQGAALRDRAGVLAAKAAAARGELAAAKAGLRAALGGLDAAVADYHERARGLQMVPRGAKYSMGADFTLRVEERALAACAEEGYGQGGDDVRATAYALLGANMKEGVKEKVRYLKGLLIKKANESRSSILAATDAAAELATERAAAVKAAEDAAAATAAGEAAVRAEAERTEARLREGAAELARGEALKAEKRAAAAAAGSARAELSPAVLGELEAAIDHMALTQAAERARLADAVSRLVLRVEEHRRGVAARLTAAAANAIAFKDGVRLGEAERAARLAAPLALAATPAAASASIAAGASMIIAAGGASALMAGGGGAGTPAAARRAPAGGRATPAAEPAPFSSPAAAALARHRGGAAGTPGGGLSVRQL